ncbi:protein FAR-RED ELONGATED HYPOCOTYL 3-like [Arachis stenosperma]|uniref:protein FAR-RED ELONGATED HYPOCOTYL 3-like n=1 Tax=Arachis stenosperma TaxID=217475 RepID=UPI0025AC054C|nr:protein FAR-RED ELONGATED HYPOCOTYL 3-like [Arachis stenosperma]
MSVCHTIENNGEAGIRLSKIYQSFVAAAVGHHELNFIERDVRNYITREVQNVSELDDAKEFGKYLLRMKKKNQNFFFELELEDDQSIKLAFWADARSRAACEYFGDVIHLTPPIIQTGIICYFNVGFVAWEEMLRKRFSSINAKGYQGFSAFNEFAVTYDSVAAQVKCQCLLFESRGILCRHSLSVLSFERVTKVSPRYILERWSKNVKKRHTHIKSNHDAQLLAPRSKRFDELLFRSQNICEFTSEFEVLTAILHCAYDNVVVEMEELKVKRKGTCSLSHEDDSLESVNELQSPPMVRTRGHPKNRLGSKLDKQIANASKKKKMKVLSELNLFYAASVVQPNSNQYHEHVINYQFRDPVARDRFLGV